MVLAALWLAGCQEAVITTYTAPREARPLDKKSAGPQRLLVAMFARPDEVWFFRLDGPKDEVDQQAEAFAKLVQSVRFAGKGEPPAWTMPEGWTREPGNQFRFATLRVGNLVGRVSKLTAESAGAASVVENVKRFRREVGLPEEPEPKDTRTIDVSGVPATWIDVVGPGGKSGPPFMKF